MASENTEDIQRFHRWSRTYERSLGQFFFFNLVHGAVLKLASSADLAPQHILDVGCGTGRLLRKAVQRWPRAELIGVDPAEGMIENARRLTSFATFYVAKGEDLPIPDSSVDLAFSTVSFHHWEDQAQGVREMARVLRPGGRFCLADGNIPAALAGIIPHSRIHTRKEIRALFEAAGLTVMVQRGIVAGTVLATVGRK